VTVRRRLVWTAVVLAVLLPPLFLGAYAATTRWLLSGPKLRALINGSPRSFVIDWDEATSSWPGRVRIHNLRLRGSDPNVEWTVRLENAELRYSVLALLRRTFLCERLDGTGLAFALRGKIDPKDVKSIDVSLLPPIPGFPDPPLRTPEENSRIESHPWLVDVRYVAIDRFEDIWVNALHYVGPARVAGGFLLRPTHLARIGPATLRFDGGALRIGGASEGLTLVGSLATESLPFEPLQAPGREALKEFTTDLKVDAKAEHLETVTDFIRFPEGVRLAGNGPTIRASLSMREGVASGHVSLVVRGGVAQTRSYRLRGDLVAEVPFKKWDLVGPLTVDVSGTHVALTDIHASGAEEARGWWGKFDVPSGKVGAKASAHVEARCRDGRPLLALFGVELPAWTNALSKLEDFTATAEVAATPGTIRVKDLAASGGNFQIHGQFAHDGKAARGEFLIESGILIVGVEVAPTGTTVRPLFAKQWYANLQKQRTAQNGGA
jgi:hypothetical protein